MRHDIVTGLAVSALVHAGVFFGSALFPSAPAPKPPAAAPDPTLPFIQVIPQPPPDDLPQRDAVTPTAQPVTVAPPSLPDIPPITPSGGFTQQLEPPLPPGITPDSSLIAVPEGRPGPGGLPGQVFDPSSLDRRPVARVQSPPQYPFEMRRDGITGQVVVDFIVDANGDVRNAYAVSSTRSEFETAAVRAVSQWKFTPGQKAGRAVNTHMQVPIVFSLGGN